MQNVDWVVLKNNMENLDKLKSKNLKKYKKTTIKNKRI